MIACYNEWYVLNGNIYSSENFELPSKSDLVLYEVIRVIDGIPLFLEDHIERLYNSAKLKNVEKKIDENLIISDINSLIKINNDVNGNIRYSIFFYDKELLRYAHYTKHEYPDKEMYETGAKLKSLKIERPEPNIKTIHSEINEKTEKLLADKYFYEIALVNFNGMLTEGSRSNLFFVKDNKLYTSKDNQVLPGITRKLVINIAKNSKIELIKDNVYFSEIHLFESAFLTGTSPKILPVQSIDKYKFNPENKITAEISLLYDNLIKNYIENHKIEES